MDTGSVIKSAAVDPAGSGSVSCNPADRDPTGCNPAVFDPVAYINTPRWQASRLGLERIRELLERLGRPQDALKFVHVAGTNGKGSVCAFTAAVLQAAGYKTGLFTSPYIERFEERIRVNGEMISENDLRDVTLEVRGHAEAMAEETGDHPTEFELMTAVALVHFARQRCDIAVVEVGLGGRLDSTNAIDAPEVCVITRIGLDHTALLGNTIAEIAGEKAGIIKPGAAVVSWPQDAEAMEVVAQRAAACDCELRVPDFSQLEEGAVQWSGEEAKRAFACKGAALATQLVSSYQPQNAAVTLEVVEALRAKGWNIPDQAVREGIAQTRWPGRFEIVEGGSAPDAFALVVDGGHNPQGAQALVESLNEVFPGRKAVFVIGVLEDKNYPEMLEAVLPHGSAFVCVTPDNPRALPAHKLARAIRWTGQDLLGCSACVSPYVAKGFEGALTKARQLAGEDGLICAFGSLYSVAAVKAAARATR